ncbi:MAG: Abi family protein [Bacilli bacterium]|nr:Abi family protein [Bacilli bacterium]MDD4407132.1 Abi family protein [Bacilli bacterium]
MAKKVFKTIDEQIAIMQDKGLIIDNIDYAKDILIRENYFFLNGYRHLFLKSPNDRYYIDSTTFKELYSVFNFDRQIRNIIFKNLLIIENNMKSIFSYQLSKEYGYRESDYLKASNFTNNSEKSRQVNDLLKKMKRQIRVNGSQHAATSHYANNYGYIPMWVVVKVLSFGIISELYLIMKRSDQDAISSIYDISVDNLTIYMPILANYRNLCAHEDILYNHKNQRSISDTKYHSTLNIPIMDGEYIYGKNDLFALIVILKQLLREEEFRLLMNELSYEVDILTGKLHSIEISKVLDAMGFPLNFKELSNM